MMAWNVLAVSPSDGRVDKAGKILAEILAGVIDY
jgi:hypothetical protein